MVWCLHPSGFARYSCRFVSLSPVPAVHPRLHWQVTNVTAGATPWSLFGDCRYAAILALAAAPDG